MEELPASERRRILPLVPAVEQAGHMAFVHAVLERRMPGRVLVDDVAAPRTALVLTASGFHFALGEPDATAVDSAIPGLLEREGSVASAALWATSRAWESALDRVFAARVTRKEFERDGTPRVDDLPALSANHRLAPLDAAVAARLADSVDDWLLRAWGGIGPFVEQAFGVAILRGEEIASFCAACALGGGEAEVEVGTAPRHRRRGLATHAALAFFSSCERRGLRPAWTCASGNVPSERLARRLGFRPVRYVAGYPLRPDMERHDGRWRPVVQRIRRRRRR
jgi:RimJ/RimL family protein N-acetyltransferase